MPKGNQSQGWDNRDKLGYDHVMTELAAETAEAKGKPLNRKERRALAKKRGKR